MRKLTGLTTWSMAAMLALALGIVPLAACSSAEDVQEPAADVQELNEEAAEEETTEEETAEDEASTDEAGAEEPAGDEVAAENEAVWVNTKMVGHTEYTDDDPFDYEVTMELDEAGNAVSETYVQGDETSIMTSEYDENGWQVSTTYANQDVATFENEYDERGRLVRRTDSYGTTVSFEYDENDRLVKSTHVSEAFEVDENMEKIEGTEFENTTVVNFNEDGLVSSRVISSKDGTSTMTYSYEYDAAGNPVGYTRTDSYTDADGNAHDDTEPTTATFVCDEHGNVIEVTINAPWGTESVTYTYELVEHPSLAVSVNAHARSF